MKKPNIQHSNQTASWFTPEVLVDAARTIMGSIDLDPTSCDEAQDRINADEYYTSEEDGLEQSWWGNVFLNPPSKCDSICPNQRCSCQYPRRFMAKAFEEFYNGENQVDNIFYVGFNIGQLKYFGRIDHNAKHVVICTPIQRIHFVNVEGVISKSPTHENFLMLITEDIRVRTRFVEHMSVIGTIWEPRN